MNYQEIKALYEKHGYRFYTGKYAINLFGIRNGYNNVDEFDDLLGIAFQDSFGNNICIVSEGTTKPGYYWLKTKTGNANGTAILIPGQYVKCWKIGLHNGNYEALQQNGAGVFKVWRDNDSDGQFDVNGQVYTDVGGLNMHTTSFNSLVEKVGAYSAGCQVRKYDEDHVIVMKILRKAADLWNNTVFSYTLFDK